MPTDFLADAKPVNQDFLANATPARPAGLPPGVDLPQLPAHPAVTMHAPQTIQQSFDENTRTNPNEPLLETGLKSTVGAIGTPFVHPINTVTGMGHMLLHPLDTAHQEVNDLYANPSYEGTKMAGQLLGGAALGAAGGELLPRVANAAGDAGSALREAAMENPDAAAVRGLKVPANSPKMQKMVSSVQTARPYLQGAQSLKDLQRLIPQAKNEIWNPYQQTIEGVRDNPVKGPDGMTTIGELEKERLQLSALNRGLKNRLPEAIQEAQQKGMSAADLLDREKAVTGALDPELSKYGIDPQGIRRNFGAVARVGNQVSGKDTLIEPQQPYGFGKLTKFDITKPLKDVGNLGSGIRDLVAGRPLFRGSPTDVGIREGFRGNLEKPDLGQYTPFKPAGLLNKPPIEMGAPPEVGGTPEGYRPPNFYHDTDAMRTGRLLNAPPIELGGSVEPTRAPNFYHDTTPMRTGRLLGEPEAPPIELHGATEGTRPPPFHYDTTPMRMGRILPEPGEEIPLSSHSDIFPQQRPGSRLMPKTIEGKK